MFKDLSNYFFIRRTLFKAKQTENWKTLGLNCDWVGRIWTIINLRAEDIGEEALVKKARVVEKIKPINSFLYDLEIGEIVFPAVEQKTDRSYLIVYSPIFTFLSVWNVFLTVTVSSIAFWIISHFSLLEKLLSLWN